MCGGCAAHYFSNSQGECEKCTASVNEGVWLAVAVLLYVVGCVVLYRSAKGDSSLNLTVGFIILAHYQVTSKGMTEVAMHTVCVLCA